MESRDGRQETSGEGQEDHEVHEAQQEAHEEAMTLVDELLALGVRRGSVLVVHTAFSKIGPVEGGPAGLIEALRLALGPDGTLVMPSMSDDDEHPFDRRETPCMGMGIVAETFWRLPNVLRSDSPHAFAAIGPRAAEIVAPHPPDVPHGLDSPVGRVYSLDGDVLLLGVGHDGNTTIHLAESIAGVRYRRPKYLTVLEGGRPVRFPYEEIDHCCERFSLMDGWLDAHSLQRRGPVGHGVARFMRSRDVVETAVAHLREDETVFLHPVGVDEECDEARASLTSPPRGRS
jgi:aminoglycoside 3-N-acetyltransferase